MHRTCASKFNNWKLYEQAGEKLKRNFLENYKQQF